jgi:hypothetical protein
MDARRAGGVCECRRIRYVPRRLMTRLTTRAGRDWILHWLGGVLGMKHTRLTRSGTIWPGLAVAAFLISGCAQKGGWNGIYAIDAAGGARTCVAPATSPPDGKAVLAQIQVSNEGGWCGISLNRGGVAYDSYLMVTRPTHGRIFAHHVGNNTRIDYTPDAGFVGTDRFAIRLIPGNAEFEAAVTVTQ